MINAKEMKKLTEEKQENVINNALIILEEIMKLKTTCHLVISSKLIELPDILIPKLRETLAELGYTVYTKDSIITIEWE